jgi:hypothetical protein
MLTLGASGGPGRRRVVATTTAKRPQSCRSMLTALVVFFYSILLDLLNGGWIQVHQAGC